MDEFGKLVHTIKSLLVTVSNRLNARQSEVLTEFRLKSSIKPIESIWFEFGVSLEMSTILKSILSMNLPSLCIP